MDLFLKEMRLNLITLKTGKDFIKQKFLSVILIDYLGVNIIHLLYHNLKKEKDYTIFALKQSYLSSDCLDILISQDKFNDLFSTYDIGNCIVRAFELNYNDFEMYQEDYTLLVYSDAKDENIIMWCANSD